MVVDGWTAYHKAYQILKANMCTDDRGFNQI